MEPINTPRDIEKMRALAYSKGYAAALRRKWPMYVPPVPDDPVVAEVCAALENLRIEIDGLLATLMPDDQWNLDLTPHIERADSALLAVSQWVREQVELKR